jgi:hypothetical protein
MRIARSSTVIISLVATDDDDEADFEDNLEPEKVDCAERKDKGFPILVVGMNALHGEYSCSERNRMAIDHRDDKIVMVVSPPSSFLL